MQVTKTVRNLVILAAMLSTSVVRAQAYSTEESPEQQEQEVELMMESRMAQADFFQQLQENLANGMSMDVAGSQCKYVSAIFTPAIPKVVTLTFDDGPSAELTPELLDVLKAEKIKATFFLRGDHATQNPEVVKRALREGHIIANHSWNHPSFHDLSPGDQVSQISTTDQALRRVMKPLRLFRYPFGNSTCASNIAIRKMGYHGIVGWHVDSCDWAFAKTGKVTQKQAAICEVAPENMSNYVGHVLASVKKAGGGVILMHDTHVRTVANVRLIVGKLKAKGYRFTNLDDPRMAQFFFR